MGTGSLHKFRYQILKSIVIKFLWDHRELIEYTIIIVWNFAYSNIPDKDCEDKTNDRCYNLTDIGTWLSGLDFYVFVHESFYLMRLFMAMGLHIFVSDKYYNFILFAY